MQSYITYESPYLGQGIKLRPTKQSICVLNQFFERFCIHVRTSNEDIVLIEQVPKRLEEKALREKCESQLGEFPSREQFAFGEVEYWRIKWKVLGRGFETEKLLEFVGEHKVRLNNGGPLQYSSEFRFFWNNPNSESQSAFAKNYPFLDSLNPNKLGILLSKHSCYADFNFTFVAITDEDIDFFKGAIQFLIENLKTTFRERKFKFFVLNKTKTAFKRTSFRF